MVGLLAACASQAKVDPRSPFDVDDPRAQPGYVVPAAAAVPVVDVVDVADAVEAGDRPPLASSRRFRLAVIGARPRLDGAIVELVAPGSRRGAIALGPGDVLVGGDGRTLAAHVALRVLEPGSVEDAPLESAVLWVGGRRPPKPPHTHVGLALVASALGAGIDVAVPVADRLNLRVGGRALTVTRGFVDDNIHYGGELDLRSLSAAVDWFFLGGELHLSAGVMVYDGNRATGSATVPAGEMFRLHHVDLLSAASDPVHGTAIIDFPRVAPTLVLGWGNLIPRGHRRWSIPVELGLVYARAPTTVIALAGTVCDPDGSPCRDIRSDPLLQGQLELRQAEVDLEVAPLRFLPVLAVAVGYKF
jgi:hypothetical protein